MSRAELLGRLAARGSQVTGEGFGGFSRLEQCDIAHALVGLGKGQTCLMRAMYAGDTGTSNMRDLYAEATRKASHVCDSRHVRLMARRAVDEFVYPQITMCTHCMGAGRVQPNQHNPNGECFLCGSTGKRTPTDEEMASVFEVPLTEYRRVWLPAFLRVYASILGWHSEGVARITAKLRQ